MSALGAASRSLVAKLIAGGVASRVVKTNDGTTMVLDQILTADIAANAVTQTAIAVGSTSSPTTTSGTFVDIPEMTVTMTTVGGDLLVWLADVVYHSVGAGIVEVALSLDGAAEVAPMSLQGWAASGMVSGLTVFRFTGVGAGSHTVKGRWRISFTAGTITSYLTHRYLLGMEVRR